MDQMSKKHIFLLPLHSNEADDVIILVSAISHKYSLKISNEKGNSVENGNSYNF